MRLFWDPQKMKQTKNKRADKSDDAEDANFVERRVIVGWAIFDDFEGDGFVVHGASR